MTMKNPLVKLRPVEQVGVVVNDIEKAIEFYESTFGIGPFHAIEVSMDQFTYKGKAGNGRLKLAFAKSGPIEIELIQVLEGETPHTEFLREKGEGLQHLRFKVDDLDKTLADLSGEGIVPVFYQRISPEFAFAYINSDKTGGVMFELLENKIVNG